MWCVCMVLGSRGIRLSHILSDQWFLVLVFLFLAFLGLWGATTKEIWHQFGGIGQLTALLHCFHLLFHFFFDFRILEAKIIFFHKTEISAFTCKSINFGSINTSNIGSTINRTIGFFNWSNMENVSRWTYLLKINIFRPNFNLLKVGCFSDWLQLEWIR